MSDKEGSWPLSSTLTHRPEDVPLEEEAALWGFLGDESWEEREECVWAQSPRTQALQKAQQRPWLPGQVTTAPSQISPGH